jgi:hypothetical protein
MGKKKMRAILGNTPAFNSRPSWLNPNKDHSLSFNLRADPTMGDRRGAWALVLFLS